MSTPSENSGFSRRRFVERLARGSVVAGAAAVARGALQAAETNPFAYDVGPLAKTDPAWVNWHEVKRWSVGGRAPRRLAFGPGDVLHVAAESQVLRFNREGAALPPLATTGAVTCVAVAGDGTVYASLRDHLEVFAPGGGRSAAWESPGPRTWISSLALGHGGLWAADSGARVILRYDLGGKLLGRIGAREPGRNVPGLVVPSPFLDVKVHPDGLLRVNNPGRHRFEAYTADGECEGTWGAPTAAIKGFCGCCNPIALAVLPDGRMVTCEKGLPRVKVYDAAGELAGVVAGTESFPANMKAGGAPGRGGLDAAVDSAGRVHVLDRVTATVHVFAPGKAGA
ncbi:MAG: hypothetical protein HZC55_09935 [Verrucomicrobia bacterium]|nr:hypothetical protein [Verrucomicrobiota bacterium]